MTKEPVNKSLYKYVKSLADKKFLSKTGIYKSSWIVREYKRRGGKYKGKKPSYKSPGLKRWYKERWVDLNRPIKNIKGKIVGYKSCGRTSVKSSKDKYPLCRPLKKITSKTPKTVKSLSKRSILKAKKKKSKLQHKGRVQFGGKMFKCQYCSDDILFDTKSGLKNHIKKYHKENFLLSVIDNFSLDNNDYSFDIQDGGDNSFKFIKEHVKTCKDKRCSILDKVECQLCDLRRSRASARQGDNDKCKDSQDKSECEKMYKQVGSGPQYYGKRSSIMVKVPENVKKTALYAFKLKKLGFRGGHETGWKRAKQLATKDEIPIEDVKYMRAWFARHIYASYPTYKKWKNAGRPKDKEWHNKNGVISWLIWGADSAFKWVNSKKIINLLNKHYPGKNYKSLLLKK
jgi:hypothetical protein|uniref:DUF5872 domain-containing protein n=1 Tax=viral metagenome TaxID=1070528 RepID=A0A6C0AM70_9ZZZZ